MTIWGRIADQIDESARERAVFAGSVTHTGLLWRIRRSLLTYVRRIPDGRISIEGDVGLTPDLAFHFPLDDDTRFDPVARTGLLRFRGTVHLSGHAGALSVALANPALRVRPDRARLSIDPSDGVSTGERVELVGTAGPRPVLVGDVLELSWAQPSLTPAGAALLGGVYPVGAVFDPLVVRVPSRCEAGAG